MNYKLFSLVSGTLILFQSVCQRTEKTTQSRISSSSSAMTWDMAIWDAYGQPFIRTPIWMRWQARYALHTGISQEVPSVLLPELHL